MERERDRLVFPNSVVLSFDDVPSMGSLFTWPFLLGGQRELTGRHLLEAGKPKVPTQLAATSSLANRVGSGGEEGPTTGHKVLKFDRRGGPSSALDF